MPHYLVLCRKMSRLEVDIDGSLVRVSGSSTPMTLLADSSGLKQCNCGEWIRSKWKVRRGFVKLHLLADADTKRILAVAVTDEQTGDSPVLRDLLGTVVKPRDRKPQKRQDRRMALICTKTHTVGDPLPHVGSSPPNTLAEGTPPLALLCGRQPRSHRV